MIIIGFSDTIVAKHDVTSLFKSTGFNLNNITSLVGDENVSVQGVLPLFDTYSIGYQEGFVKGLGDKCWLWVWECSMSILRVESCGVEVL